MANCIQCTLYESLKEPGLDMLVLIANASSESFDETVLPHSLARVFAACKVKEEE